MSQNQMEISDMGYLCPFSHASVLVTQDVTHLSLGAPHSCGIVLCWCLASSQTVKMAL